MNVLIVDDEIPAVEGTKQLLDWAALGCDRILTAYSTAEASAILERETVDLLVCDIEMPGESGLALIGAVRARFPTLPVILLTAHENFRYAREAVRLGCCDYVLKPAEPSVMETAVRRAIGQYRTNHMAEKYREYGELWLANRPVVVERFWWEILRGTIPPEEAVIEAEARRRAVPYTAGTVLLPVLVSPRRESAGDIRQRVENAMGPLFAAVSILTAEGYLLGIGISPAPADTETIRNALSVALTGLAVYIGSSCGGAALPETVRRLVQRERDNVRGETGVFAEGGAENPSVQPPVPDFALWSQRLLQGREPLLETLKEYRQSLEPWRLDAQFILQFHHDFLQMTYAVLDGQGVQAHRLLEAASQRRERMLTAVKTVDDVFEWAQAVAETAADFLEKEAHTETVMEKVERFVRQRIADDLSRDEIAAYVYLNPDYLSRIVKRETGLPISEYIQKQRMETAKELLTHTERSISEVALAVGYPHFSQFAKIFRKHTGKTPRQYRQENQR